MVHQVLDQYFILMPYEFPGAAITKYNKLSGLNSRNLLSQF